ncbi:response regulator [Brevundimonas sp. S30B]|uniref:response regulator FixJ n=1 Tax=unclassified Brevundimonas TaxID=2622653 RepID=UPI0010724D4F|nr:MULTISPECIES: response regulator FixJ [unclassified Brevundimonas]QBX38567.1 response regulator [Brevundimonas sp. MF30-B]TFW00483.1 response regulator [Brevundimonas sp. S30B]TFW01870.1 response regulator [Brevundimonas sp. S30B]
MTTDTIIHIVDDDVAVRDSIAFLLETADLTARTYESAVAFLAENDRPAGCIVTDVRMPDMTGLELARRLRDTGSVEPVIVITGHADVPLAIEAMRAGVVDFIEKPFDDEVLLTSIHRVLEQATRATSADADRREFVARLESLSPRERDVVDGLVKGHANKVIAFDLGISPRTVEVYRANAMTKMQAGSLSELVRIVMTAG